MDLKPLAFDAPLSGYIAQADALLAGWHSRNENAIRVFRSRHPKFLDDKIPWLERDLTDAEVRATPIDRDDARLALARWYEFQDWQRLEEYVASVQQPGPIARFERAVEAVIDGDIADAEAVARRGSGTGSGPFDTRQQFRSADASLDAAALPRRERRRGLSAALAEERGRRRESPARSRRRSERVVLGVRRPVHDAGAARLEHSAGGCRRAGAAGRNADRSRRLACAGGRGQLDLAD